MKNFSVNKYLPMALLFILSHSPVSGEIIVADQKISSSSAKGYNYATRNSDRNAIPVFKTIQAALGAANEGDTIVVREGMYKEAVVINKKGITLKNFNNEKVVIDGNNPRLGPLVRIEASDINLSGLTVMHSSTFGIYSINNNNVRVMDCEVAYSEDGGVVFVNGENVVVEHCRVHHNNYRGLKAAHEGITMRGVRNFEVRYCEVFDNKEEGIDAKYGAFNGKIHHNHVYRNNGPNIYLDVANKIEIFNNIIHSAVSKSGISLNIETTWRPEEAGWTVHDIKVYNNVIYDNHGGIGFWLEAGKGAEENAHWDKIAIVNNTFVNNAQPDSPRGGGIYVSNGGPHNFGDHIVIKNNILWEKTNGSSRCIRDYTGKIVGKFSVANNAMPKGEPTDAVGKNPVVVSEIHFVDPHNHDYRLTKKSPAIGKGDKLGVPLLDFDDKARSRESGYDIGAFTFTEASF